MGRQRQGFRVLGPYTRPDGRFSVLVRGPGLEGGTDTKAFYFRDKAKALKARRDLEADFKRRLETTLAEAVDIYLEDELKGSRQLRPSTVAEARARLNPLIRLAPESIADVRPEHVHERLKQLSSAASQKGTLVRTNDFFRFAVEARLVRSNPCDGITVKAKAKRGKTTLARAEARILEAHLWTEIEAGGDDAEVALAVLLLLYLGLRRAELLRLQVRDIDSMTERTLLSVERQAKTDQGFRDIEVPQRVSTVLVEHMKDRELDDWLWPSPTSVSGHRGETWVLKGTKRLCRRAGVTEVCPQGLRGTHSKLARKAGETAHAIQAQLGHEDVRTSVDSYIGQDVEAQERTRRAQAVLGSD